MGPAPGSALCMRFSIQTLRQPREVGSCYYPYFVDGTTEVPGEQVMWPGLLISCGTRSQLEICHKIPVLY